MTEVAFKNRYQQRRAEGRRPASVDFPEPLYEEVRRQAEIEERSIAAIVRIAVREYLDQHPV